MAIDCGASSNAPLINNAHAPNNVRLMPHVMNAAQELYREAAGVTWPNPTSELAERPADHVLSPDGELYWEAAGHFWITDDVLHWCTYAPNDIFDIDQETIGPVAVQLTLGHYRTPWEAAQGLQDDLNADVTLTADFQVLYDDEYNDIAPIGAAPTYKFIIRTTDGKKFRIPGAKTNKGNQTFGLTFGGTYETSWAANGARYHTEEWLTFALTAGTLGAVEGFATYLQQIRWAVLSRCNAYLASSATGAYDYTDYEGPRIDLLFSGTPAGAELVRPVAGQWDSWFPVHQGPAGPGGGYAGVHDGLSGYFEDTNAGPSTYIVSDVGSIALDEATAVNRCLGSYGYVLVRIQMPHLARPRLSNAYFGGAIVLENFGYQYGYGVESGADELWRKPSRILQMDWSRTIREEDLLMIEALLTRYFRQEAGAGQYNVPRSHPVGDDGHHRFGFIIDPLYMADLISRSNASAAQRGALGVWARGMMHGKFLVQPFNGARTSGQRYDWQSVTFIEDAM